MLPDFGFNHCSKVWRIIYVACTLLVFSYILFDVLDLDGSDFPSARHPLERTVAITEVAKDTEHVYSLDRSQFWVDLLLLRISGEAVLVRLTRALIFSRLDSARSRSYRVALPRSSTIDPFHSG
jgi:hypothetical protein